jgi:hypothetical protein
MSPKDDLLTVQIDARAVPEEGRQVRRLQRRSRANAMFGPAQTARGHRDSLGRRLTPDDSPLGTAAVDRAESIVSPAFTEEHCR